MLMDNFIKKKDYVKAALVAHEILLQENSENELTLSACLFSCMHFLDGLKKNQIEIVLKDQEETSETKVRTLSNQNESLTIYFHVLFLKKKLLVRYLRKPYNDEHFDLKDPILLTGKTIYFAANNLKTIDTIMSNSLKVFAPSFN